MKRKNVDVAKEFLLGNAFARVSSKQGFYKFVKRVQELDLSVIVDVSESMIEDFDKKILSKEYYLVHFVGANTVHCADKEFFDFVYKTETPFIQADNKILWFEV